jgi:hypothetical protein
MLLDISGNTFSSLGNPQDIDVQRFISAASITSTTEIQAIDNLVYNLKQNNLWDRMQAIYPFVGGTANSNKYNLKDQRDADAAFRLAFSGSWAYSSTGVRMTTSANTNFIRTFYTASTNASLNDAHISAYIDAGTSLAACAIGAVDAVTSTSPALQLLVGFDSIAQVNAQNIGSPLSIVNSGGFHLANRSTSTAQQYYLNGALSASNSTSSTTLTIQEINIARRGGASDRYHPAQFRFATIGRSLTSGENAALYNAIQAFQTTLGRQVGTSTTSPTRPTLSNVPTVIYQPSQILGTGMTIWYDFNDKSTLFTDSGGTTNNVQNSGDYILYVKNKAPNRLLYDLQHPTPSVASGNTTTRPLTSFTANSTSVFVYSANCLNTNKSSEFLWHNGTVNNATTLNGVLRSISGYSTSGKSAFTWSGVYRVGLVTTAYNTTSFSANIFIITTVNNNNTSITVAMGTGTATVATFPINLTRTNGYYYLTITLDQNKNGIVYFQNQKITTSIFSGTTYPLLASTNPFSPFYRDGGVQTIRASRNSELVEFCFNDSEVLTDDQVAKLHQYYRVKYNLPLSAT